jgi:hypothetical protein
LATICSSDNLTPHHSPIQNTLQEIVDSRRGTALNFRTHLCSYNTMEMPQAIIVAG